MGLYESLLGNSGLAISDSTAPSFYNPSLLTKKKGESYSLSGSSFGATESKDSDHRISSFELTPNYLSSIMIGESLNHEIFLYSSVPSKMTAEAILRSADSLSQAKAQMDSTTASFGYSMAFKNFPLGLSYLGEFVSQTSTTFSEYQNSADNSRSTTYSTRSYQGLNLFLSASGHFTVRSYTMGFNYKTRPLRVFEKSNATGSIYYYNPVLTPPYQKVDQNMSTAANELAGQMLAIGHGFKVGDHEFLTDSVFQEKSDYNQAYDLTQSFGYRMNSDSGHQFLCGMNHLINPEIKYFGESAYYSVGYSWLTRSLRSAIGVYYYSSKFNQDVFAVGLSFGSEFSY